MSKIKTYANLVKNNNLPFINAVGIKDVLYISWGYKQWPGLTNDL